MQSLAYRTYGNVQRRTAGDKDLEFALFKLITEELEQVKQAQMPAPAVWADALSRNLQLWTVLATDLLSPGNAMPEQTKSGLLGLSEFVRRTTMHILSGGGDTEIEDLIDINKDIMQGLTANNLSEAVGVV